MDSYDKKYDAFQIPGRPQAPGKAAPPEEQEPLSESFYEIEYDSCPMPGVGKYVLKSRKIEAPERDEIRELFNRMRDIAREDRYLTYNSSRFYDRRVRQENARIFYRQGIFMKDFEDNYEPSVPFSSYFPDYQMMGYEQLRTYFTWRTQIRRGNVADTSLSYFFLYCYELLNNIGVDSPVQGLEQLMFFWNAFRIYHPDVDKYMLKWLKDYHIYYELPWSFKEFLSENGLASHYPRLSDPGSRFDLLCSLSKYDIRKSSFYSDDTVVLIRDCFDFLLEELGAVFEDNHMNLDSLLFQPTKNMTPWTPFGDALFCPGSGLPDRQVVLSEKEIYLCRQGRWTFNTTITTESGKRLIGYVFKQMESVLRRVSGYRYKLSANINALNSPLIEDILHRTGMDLEKLVTDITTEFYREANRTVVSVDPASLERIRREALATQERLIVEDESPVRRAETSFSRPVSPAPEGKGHAADIPGTTAQEPSGFLPQGMSGDTASAGADAPLPADALDTAHLAADMPPSGAAVLPAPSGTAAYPAPPGTAAMHQAPSHLAATAMTRSDAATLPNPSDTAAAAAMAPSDTAYTPPPGPSLESVNADIEESTHPAPWQALWLALTLTERQALYLLCQSQTDAPLPPATQTAQVPPPQDITQFARAQGVMPEVLMDGINGKAMDFVGDSLFDGEFLIYDDYVEQVKEMVKGLWQDKYPQE